MLPVSEFAAIPYLDLAALPHRFVPAFAFHDQEWRLWLPVGEDRRTLQEIKGIPGEACYFALDAVGPSDLWLPFFEFLGQRANYLPMQRAFSGIVDDLFNLSGSLAKLELIATSHDRIPYGLSRMAASEVEYIILVVRSLFDLFQEVMARVWDSVTLLDGQAKKQSLKRSFGDMLTFKGEPAEAPAIAARFGLPANIAKGYAAARPVFEGLKRLRDNIVHHGSQLPHIFSSTGSLQLAREDNPFPDVDIWNDSEATANGLVPLRPVVEVMIHRCFSVCDDLAAQVQAVIELPPPVAPKMHLFIRGDFTDHLVAARAWSAERMKAS